MKKSISILILAAGSASRMGMVKQLLPWKDTTLLGNAINIALSTTAKDVLVILGANADSIKDRITARNTVFLENKHWKSGMGSSISCGMDYLLKRPKSPDGVLIVLCDQPLIDTFYLNQLIDTFINGKVGIVGTNYGTKIGVPAVFEKKYFLELQTLDVDFGASDILAKNRNDSIALMADVILILRMIIRHFWND